MKTTNTMKNIRWRRNWFMMTYLKNGQYLYEPISVKNLIKRFKWYLTPNTLINGTTRHNNR